MESLAIGGPAKEYLRCLNIYEIVLFVIRYYRLIGIY